MYKKILTILPYKVDAGAKQQEINFVYQTYLNKLVDFDLLPLLAPARLAPEMLLELYAQADGVLLMGGADVDPSLYQAESHPYTKPTNPLRDTAEAQIIRLALSDKKPLLGICRGMQMVNVVLGGSLIQHLPDNTAEIHFPTSNQPSYDEVASDRGQVMLVQKGTRLAKIIGGGKHNVRCAHHQAVEKLGAGLAVNALSEQGIIEGLEGTDPSHFLLLIQSHPETQHSVMANKLWQVFAEAVGRSNL